MKGIFEFEVEGGKKVGFKIGTFGLSVASEKEDCSLDILFRRCGFPYQDGTDSEGNPKFKADKPKLKALLHFFYGAAVHYAEDNDRPVDFKVSTVSNWLDEIGLENLNRMIKDGLNQYVPKNSTSPAKTGEPVLQ
jgi:hypothetical protein